MSDNPRDDTWWMATDGKWYPPSSHPMAWADNGTPPAGHPKPPVAPVQSFAGPVSHPAMDSTGGLSALLGVAARGEAVLILLGWNVDQVIDDFNRRFNRVEPTERDLRLTDPLIAHEADRALPRLIEIKGDLIGLSSIDQSLDTEALGRDYLEYLDAWIDHLEMVVSSPKFWDLDPGGPIAAAWHNAIRSAHHAGIGQSAAVQGEIDRLFPASDLGAPPGRKIEQASPAPPASPAVPQRTSPAPADQVPKVQAKLPSPGWRIAAFVVALVGAFIPVAIASGNGTGSVSVIDVLVSGAVWFAIIWFVGWLVGVLTKGNRSEQRGRT